MLWMSIKQSSSQLSHSCRRRVQLHGEKHSSPFVHTAGRSLASLRTSVGVTNSLTRAAGTTSGRREDSASMVWRTASAFATTNTSRVNVCCSWSFHDLSILVGGYGCRAALSSNVQPVISAFWFSAYWCFCHLIFCLLNSAFWLSAY